MWNILTFIINCNKLLLMLILLFLIYHHGIAKKHDKGNGEWAGLGPCWLLTEPLLSDPSDSPDPWSVIRTYREGHSHFVIQQLSDDFCFDVGPCQGEQDLVKISACLSGAPTEAAANNHSCSFPVTFVFAENCPIPLYQSGGINSGLPRY